MLRVASGSFIYIVPLVLLKEEEKVWVIKVSLGVRSLWCQHTCNWWWLFSTFQGTTALEDSGTSVPCCSNPRPHLADTRASLRLPQEGHRTCILVDSREIVSGSEVVSSLRAIHGLQVEVCPLNGCDYIVSNRMVVERRSQSEMLNSINKNKLIDQIQYLQSMFERICVIVEKDREKTGLYFYKAVKELDYYLVHSTVRMWEALKMWIPDSWIFT